MLKSVGQVPFRPPSVGGRPAGDAWLTTSSTEVRIRTGHGTAPNTLLAGDGVPGGVYGEAPSLTDLDDGDLKCTVDFRDAYALLLHDVLGTDPAGALSGWTGRLNLIDGATFPQYDR